MKHEVKMVDSVANVVSMRAQTATSWDIAWFHAGR